jgi:hypothetical protein
MKLITAGVITVGREYLPHVLWSETGPYTVDERVVTNLKHMLQCITNTFPTQSRLCVMKKSTDGLCRFCSSQSKCSKFNDALQ